MTSHPLRLALLLAACLAASCPDTRAGRTMKIPVRDGSGVEVDVISSMTVSPPQGMLPLRIHIRNHSGATRTWRINSLSHTRYGDNLRYDWSMDATVPHQGDQLIETLVPVISPISYAPSELTIQISGYGMTPDSAAHLGGLSRNDRFSHFSALSAQLAIRNEGLLRAYFDTQSMNFASTSLEPSDFSGDPRGYSSLDFIWITPSEWRSLSPLQINAILQWVALGGHLVFASPRPDDLAQLPGLPAGTIPDGLAHGFGLIEWMPLHDNLFDEASVFKKINSTTSLKKLLADDYVSNFWPLRRHIGDIHHPIALILVFVAAFAFLLGPVNLFLAHRRKRPSQLLWTTPLISLLASLILAGVIVVKDGFGGDGARMAIALVNPSHLSLTLLQEQCSRTGMLLNRSFPEPDGAVFFPLVVTTISGTREAAYRTQDGRMSGDWFASRAIQGQLIQQILPTRSRVEILPPGAPGAPPAVLSSFGFPLATLFYCDAGNSWWRADNLRPGERQSLAKARKSDFQDWWDASRQSAGSRIRSAMGRIAGQPGFFYAEAATPDNLLVPTLSSIRWNSDLLLLTGPAVSAGEASP